jgi:hypothetical protein
MTTTEGGAAQQRIHRAGKLLSAAEELAMQAWREDPTSAWLLHANALMTAREALAHFGVPPPADAPTGGDPAELARRARDELDGIPDGDAPAGIGVPLVYLADALSDLEARR